MKNEKLKITYKKGLHADTVEELRQSINQYTAEYLNEGELIVINDITEDEKEIQLNVTIHAEPEDIDTILNDLMRGEDLKTEVL